jgi:2-oxoisovalerate dehydrogenase E1 component
LLDAVWARRPYPGDSFAIPFGKAKKIHEGGELTVITWGAMAERCELAAKEAKVAAEIIDLRTVSPWDKNTVLASVEKTRRCLIVHEDNMTAGFGAEIAAVVAKEAFFNLDAPVERLATLDVPLPYNIPMMDSVLPGVEKIADKMLELAEF